MSIPHQDRILQKALRLCRQWDVDDLVGKAGMQFPARVFLVGGIRNNKLASSRDAFAPTWKLIVVLHDHGHQVPKLVLPAVRHEVRHRAVDLPYGTSHKGAVSSQPRRRR